MSNFTAGKLEFINNFQMTGWAVSDNFDNPQIEVFVNEQHYLSAICNRKRLDVEQSFPQINNVYNSFILDVSLNKGDIVSVYVAGTLLKGCPAVVQHDSITCPIVSIESIMTKTNSIERVDISSYGFGQEFFPIQIYKIHKGLINNNGLIFVDNMLVKESTGLFNPGLGGRISNGEILFSYKFKDMIKFPAVSLCMYGIDNYYHFLYDFLQRGVVFKEVFGTLHFLIKKLVKPFQIELSDVLDVNYHYLYNDTIYEFSDLYVIYPIRKDFYYNISALELLKNILKQNYLIKDIKYDLLPKKIYISRQNQSNRILVNESEVIEILKSKGFEIIFPEKLGLAQQAQIFSNADIIVGSSGAAFSNLIYSKSGCVVLEIFPKSEVDDTEVFWECFVHSLNNSLKHFRINSVSISKESNVHKELFEVCIKELDNILLQVLNVEASV